MLRDNTLGKVIWNLSSEFLKFFTLGFGFCFASAFLPTYRHPFEHLILFLDAAKKATAIISPGRSCINEGIFCFRAFLVQSDTQKVTATPRVPLHTCEKVKKWVFVYSKSPGKTPQVVHTISCFLWLLSILIEFKNPVSIVDINKYVVS